MHPGWLSTGEIQDAIPKLGIQGAAQHFTTRYKLKHMTHKHCQFILLHGHWTLLICLQNTLLFFDPAGQPVTTYIDTTSNHIHDIAMHVQPRNSVLCGNYCCFAAHVLTHHLPDQTPKHQLASAARMLLSRFLYTLPSPITTNCMMMTIFTYDFEIGEEFQRDAPRYPKVKAYRDIVRPHK